MPLTGEVSRAASRSSCALISFTFASRSAACLAASVTRASLTSSSVAIFFAFKTSIDFSSAAAFSSATRADSTSARADSSAASNGARSSSMSNAPDWIISPTFTKTLCILAAIREVSVTVVYCRTCPAAPTVVSSLLTFARAAPTGIGSDAFRASAAV